MTVLLLLPTKMESESVGYCVVVPQGNSDSTFMTRVRGLPSA
jgi:hypothetical protein